MSIDLYVYTSMFFFIICPIPTIPNSSGHLVLLIIKWHTSFPVVNDTTSCYMKSYFLLKML